MSMGKYRHLSNEELLNLVADKIDKSPIISELASRIDNAHEICPVCEAILVNNQERK